MGRMSHIAGLVLPGLVLLASGVLPGQAWGDESLGPQSNPVPPNVMFLIDFSASMATCWNSDRIDEDADGKKEDTEKCVPAITDPLSVWRIKKVQEIVTKIINTVEGVSFCLATTDPINPSDPDGIGNYPSVRPGIVATCSTDKTQILAKLAAFKTSVGSSGTMVVNASNATPMSEALDDVGAYFASGVYTGSLPDSPIDYYCQNNHVIFITDGVTPLNYLTYGNPNRDNSVSSAGTYPASNDITASTFPCTVDGCYNHYFDNVASYLFNTDLASSLANTPNAQHIVTHVVALDNREAIQENAAFNGGGLFTYVTDPDQLEGELWAVMNTIMADTYVISPPTVASDGGNLYLGYYEIRSTDPYNVKQGRPLYYGHLVSFDIDNDPNSSTYGQIDYSVTQPSWDAGVILASRWVGPQDVMNLDNNGVGTRDIYTNLDNDSTLDPFDASNLAALCPLMLNNTAAGVAEGHDIDGDGDVDNDDCAHLMDFVRGYYLEEFVSTGQPRGHWKLGDIRHSQVAVADHDPKIYTRNPYLRALLEDGLPATLQGCPSGYSGAKCDLDVVFVAANDGMLHAFGKQTGDELWAYIPRNLLGRTEPVSGAEMSELFDLMQGETVTFDGTPRVDFVWLDGYIGKGKYSSTERDGEQRDTEWIRVLVIGEGGGGRYYMALDITDPQHPYLLWEDTNDTNTVAQVGRTTSTPSVGLVYDLRNPPGYDRWVAFWGSGHEASGSIESRLYIKAMDDLTTTAAASERTAGGINPMDIGIKADLDGDTIDDTKGLPSNPTVVDKDNDGDVDEVFLVNSAGVMFKFTIDTTDVSKSKGCLFFDPQSANLPSGVTGQYIAPRTAAYWAATAAFNTSGQLVLYWGTGSPYDLFTTVNGHLYAVLDSDGCQQGTLYTECNSVGYIQLGSGEKVTGPPVAYAKVVYFTTFRPSSDRCSNGEGRLYGLSSEDCSVAMDTNGDGQIDSGDQTQLYVSLGDGVPSSVVISNDSIYVATTDSGATGGIEEAIQRVDIVNDPFAGTTAIQWRELF